MIQGGTPLLVQVVVDLIREGEVSVIVPAKVVVAVTAGAGVQGLLCFSL